jgi:hypothetical protein
MVKLTKECIVNTLAVIDEKLYVTFGPYFYRYVIVKDSVNDTVLKKDKGSVWTKDRILKSNTDWDGMPDPELIDEFFQNLPHDFHQDLDTMAKIGDHLFVTKGGHYVRYTINKDATLGASPEGPKPLTDFFGEPPVGEEHFKSFDGMYVASNGFVLVTSGNRFWWPGQLNTDGTLTVPRDKKLGEFHEGLPKDVDSMTSHADNLFAIKNDKYYKNLYDKHRTWLGPHDLDKFLPDMTKFHSLIKYPTQKVSFVAKDPASDGLLVSYCSSKHAKYDPTAEGWAIQTNTGKLKLKLYLPYLRGVDLRLELAKLGSDQSKIAIRVNGQNTAKFAPYAKKGPNVRAWHIGDAKLKQGDNEIDIERVAGEAPVVVKSVTFGLFTMQHQQCSEWCWAAVSTSVALFYSPQAKKTQCEVVNKCLQKGYRKLGDKYYIAPVAKPDCCNGKKSTESTCCRWWYLDEALREVGHLGEVKPRKLTIDELQIQANKGQVVCGRVGWTEIKGTMREFTGAGHFWVITGVSNTKESKLVAIQDSIYGTSYIPFSTLETGYYHGTGSWTHSYLTTN